MRLLLAYRFLRSKSNSSFINVISKISVLGIILGISILITVISVMNGFEKELKDKVLGFTSHVTAYSNDMEKISYDIFDNHIRDGEILGYSPYIEKEIMLSSAHATVSSLFRAIEPNLEKNVGETHNNIISGDYDDLARINNSIIIGSGVANKLRVNVGDDVNVGTVVCVVEAMKLFNEIESEISGKIIKVLVEDMSPIEYDQPLFLVDPS